VTARRGRMTVDGEHATIVFERRLEHEIEHVWEAITTPEGMRDWLLCTHAAIEPRVGGHVETVSGPGQYRARGTVLRWEPPRVFEYEWKVDPLPEMPVGQHALLCYELEPRDGATLLTVTYRRITRQTAVGFLPGLHAFLDRLEAQLDRRALPDWHALFATLRTEYREWTG